MSVLKKISNYFSLVKFSHTIFAMPFALIGFTLGVSDSWHKGVGTNVFGWALFLKMILSMVSARSAAMSFNRFLDRRFDALNPRTAKREIPAGVISPANALTFTILSSLVFLVVCATINKLCFLLSFVALFVVLFYSYTKRFTALCHLVLGVGLALAPIGAYLTVTGHFELVPVLFSFSVLTWVAGFDIIYALQDEQFDREQQLHSIPAMLGAKKALFVSVLLHLFSVIFIVSAGYLAHFGVYYWVGAALYIAALIYQHKLVKPGDLSKVNVAFANTNGLASVVFACFAIVSILTNW